MSSADRMMSEWPSLWKLLRHGCCIQWTLPPTGFIQMQVAGFVTWHPWRSVRMVQRGMSFRWTNFSGLNIFLFLDDGWFFLNFFFNRGFDSFWEENVFLQLNWLTKSQHDFFTIFIFMANFSLCIHKGSGTLNWLFTSTPRSYGNVNSRSTNRSCWNIFVLMQCPIVIPIVIHFPWTEPCKSSLCLWNQRPEDV